MHELWLCRNILDIVKQEFAEHKYAQVKTITLEIGKLAAVDKAALNFSFEVIKQGTIAGNATLEVIDIDAKAWCDRCQKEVIIKQYYDFCSTCGEHNLKIIDGEELKVKSIEVE